MPQPEIVHHVDAVFGGKPVRFQLHRDRATVEKLEAVVGSPNAAWGRFMSGAYTVSDVRNVLALAHPVAADHPNAARLREAATSMRVRLPHGVEPATLDRVLNSRPLATYAGLAELVMTALLIGLPPALAQFNEDTALAGVLDRYVAERMGAADAEAAAA